MEKKRVLIFGHSQCRNLNNFISNSASKVNFGMNEDEFLVKCAGFGGLKIREVINIKSKRFLTFDTLMKEFAPQQLMLFIGDNDVSQDSSAEEISGLIKCVLSILKTRYESIVHISVLQLLPRHKNKWGDHISYNSQASEINAQLLSIAKETPYLFFKQFGFYFSLENERKFINMKKYYHRDGVHLNQAGYYQLYKGIRHVIKTFCRK